MHTHTYSTLQEGSVTIAMVDEQWTTFKIKMPDFYYLDLDIGSPSPVTVTIKDEDGETVFTKTSTDLHIENMRLPLSNGDYKLLLSASSRFRVDFALD